MISKEKLEPLIKKIHSIKLFDNNWILTEKQSNNISNTIIDYFEKFHIKNPYRKGMIKDEILNSLNIEEQFLDTILDYLLNKKLLKYSNNSWSKFDFYISLTDNEKSLSFEIIDLINKSELNALSINELSNHFIKYNKNIIKKILDIEIANGNIIIINTNLLFYEKNIKRLIELVKKYFINNISLDVGSFKKITKTSRKYAVPLLEYLDKINITCRVGNERKLQG